MNHIAVFKLNLKHRLRQSGLHTVAVTIVSTVLTILPAHAAERIYFNYGPFGFSISVKELETFAQTGHADGSLGYYLDRFSPNQQAQIRDALQARFEVNPVTVAQFSYTTSGERLMKEAGELIRTPSRQNGFYGIRSAAILAAADSSGLSLLNFLRQFPTDIQIDIRQVLDFVRYVFALIRQTDNVVATLEQQSAELAAKAPIALNQSPDLRQAGEFRTTQRTLQLHDTTRDREFAVDLYLPVSDTPSSSPVIVISNGLGARRDRFDELAQHLASYGFAVAIPDHPGSDRQRLQEFYRGLHRENFDATEFVDRPLDIRFLLDTLEQLNSIDFQDQLNLQHVGIFGYSFGGTTALSLAGAEINFRQLEQDCTTPQRTIVNISLLYQCRALELSQPVPDLQDDRIKAAYMFVPFGKSLFGQTGLSQVQIPVLWEATDEDFLTPLVIEQIPAFSWLTTPDKYLAVSSGLPHAQINLDISSRLTNQSTPWSELRRISQNYHNALSVAFFKVHVAGDESYRPYLQASYTQALTEKPYTLSLVQTVELHHENE